ncbi:MAG: hypothetical protein M1830_008096 [Pleopsidium flavum]|nr:MAG: hypothetical protein M1830_008096 [Pleopsidium flavum]
MDAMDRLFQWFGTHDGQMSKLLELAKGASYGYYLRVREDGETLSKKSCVINCPYSLTLSYLNAISAPPFQSHGDSLPQQFLGDMDRHTVTVFFLMLQYLKKENSFWWPYICTLPQPEEAEKVGTPFWFSKADRLWLLGTDLEEASLSRIATWKTDWERALQRLRALGRPAEAYTWELAMWAIAILSSRSFMSGLLEDATPEPGLPHWTQSIDAHPSFPVLFPLSDLINHQPEAKMTWGKGSTHMSFIVEEEVEPRKPIWNNYGPKSNQQCEQKAQS